MEDDREAMLPLPGESFEARRVAQTRANSLSLVRFDANDYSVPVAYAHHELTVKGGIEEVRIAERDQLVCVHARIWERQQVSFDPLHYLALLERKPGAFDSARPLADWGLPDCFALLRRRLEASLGWQGTREYIKVLRLAERASLAELARAVMAAAAIGTTSSDAIALILAQRAERAVTLFALDGHPHLQAFAIEPPDLRAYAALGRQGARLMKQLESTSLVLLHHHLKALRLPTITAECEKLARQAAADNADHLTYLLQLTELELLERERKAAERRLKAAHFPTHKTLEGFDFAARPSVNKLLRLRAGALRVHRPARERALRRQPRHRQDPSGDRAGHGRLRAGLPGALLPPDRACDAAHGGPRRTLAAGPQGTPREARPADLRRARLRAGLQGRRRAALRRHLQRLRAHQPDRHHQPAVRVLDRGAGLGAPHRRDPRPAHPPLPDHRDQRRELPPA